MRHRAIRFAVGIVAATAFLVPSGSQAGLVTGYCTATLAPQSGFWTGGCELPIAGPNFTVVISALGASTTPSLAYVGASINAGTAAAGVGGVGCYAQGRTSSTTPLMCTADSYSVQVLQTVVQLPGAPGAYCNGFASGALSSAKIDCYTNSI